MLNIIMSFYVNLPLSPYAVACVTRMPTINMAYNKLAHFTTHNPGRNLRSSSQQLLSVGYMRTVSSSRCFKHSAAINWNDLPFDIRACDSVNVFKRKLKTHLFNVAYAT